MVTNLRIVHDWKTQRREAQTRIGEELYRSVKGEPTYDPDMGPKFFKQMEEGATLEECAAAQRISLVTIAAWCNPQSNYYQSDFAAWVADGTTASYAWWVALARQNLHNRHFNDRVWEKIMKHVFGWIDRAELTGADGAPLLGDSQLGVSEIATRIESLMAIAERRKLEDTI